MIEELKSIEKNFFVKHQIPMSKVIFGRNLKGENLRIILKTNNAWFAYGSERCSNKNCKGTIRNEKRCIVCNVRTIEETKKYYSDGFIYIVVSGLKKYVKVGSTLDIKKRIANLNSSKYGNADDWKIAYYAKYQNMGKIERDIQSRLNEYQYQVTYSKQEVGQEAKELFRCSYITAKIEFDAIGENNLTFKLNEDWELENASSLFNFENVSKIESINLFESN